MFELDWAARLQQTLPPALHALLQVAIEIAAARKLPLYLVGGPVRDAYLRQPITDLDLLVEGDAWLLAEDFAARTGGKRTLHEKFRTAVVAAPIAGGTCAVDFVTARRETYAAPAALPDVTPSTISDDLKRRDFTINTLALRLDHAPITLLDPFNGLADMQQGIVRVLHDRSFIDDPTRILRAARFAARLQFEVELRTRLLIIDALRETVIERTTAQRILREIELLLDEPRPEDALNLLSAWGALPALRLRWSAAWPEHFRAARAATWPDVSLHELGFGLLIWPLDREERQQFERRYNLPAPQRRLLHELPFAVPQALAQPDLDAWELEQTLQPHSLTALRVLHVVGTPTVQANIAHYLHAIRSLPPLLTGDDLRAAGIAPGPQYRALLRELRQAQLCGAITGVEQARRWLARQADER